jgi:hypothetical protein
MAARHEVSRPRITRSGFEAPVGTPPVSSGRPGGSPSGTSLTSPGGSAVGGFLGGYDVLVDFGVYEGRGICTEAELNHILHLRDIGVIVGVAFAERNPPQAVKRRPLAWGSIFLLAPPLLLLIATLLFQKGL